MSEGVRRDSRQPARRSRRPYWPLAIGLGALALAAGALLSIALQQSPMAGSPSPSAAVSGSSNASDRPVGSDRSAAASASRDSVATPIPAPLEVVPVYSRIRVLADGLRIREREGVDAPVVARLSAGEVLYVLGGGPTRIPPSFRDGYAWYPVQYIPGYADWPVDPPRSRALAGMVAAHSTSGDWLVEVVDPRCPDSLDIVVLTSITAWERASCTLDQQLTLEGTFGCGVCDALAVPGRWDPDWLANYVLPLSPLSPVGHVQRGGIEPIVLAFPPGVERPEPEDRGSVMRVVGHFNDGQSTDCVVGDDAGGLSLATASEWYCRERFVVEEWQIIGTDPDYPSPP